MTAEELSSPFGLSKSTVASKAAEIARICHVKRFDANWMLPELVASSPMVWLLEVNGFLLDIRTAPVELQIEAYERGLIPYVPALRQAEKDHEASSADQQPKAVPEKKTDEPEESTPPESEDYSDIYRTFSTE